MLDIFQLVLSKNCTQTKARWTDLAFLGLLIQLFYFSSINCRSTYIWRCSPNIFFDKSKKVRKKNSRMQKSQILEFLDF